LQNQPFYDWGGSQRGVSPSKGVFTTSFGSVAFCCFFRLEEVVETELIVSSLCFCCQQHRREDCSLKFRSLEEPGRDSICKGNTKVCDRNGDEMVTNHAMADSEATTGREVASDTDTVARNCLLEALRRGIWKFVLAARTYGVLLAMTRRSAKSDDRSSYRTCACVCRPTHDCVL
jgi:hypothetical protein